MAVQDMLMAYGDTPHPATGVTPYEAMLNQPICTRLDHEKPSSTAQSTKDQLIDKHNNQYKERMRKYQRNAKEHEFKLGDYVLLKQQNPRSGPWLSNPPFMW